MKFLKTADIQLLIFGLLTLSMIVIIGGALIASKIFEGNIPDKITSLILAFGFFISSFAGLIQIIRKESPIFLGKSIHGVIPIIIGSIWIVFSWGLVILIICFL